MRLITSMHFMAMRLRLIEKGLAYVDELSPDQMREYRGTLTEPGKTAHIVIVVSKKTSRYLKE